MTVVPPTGAVGDGTAWRIDEAVDVVVFAGVESVAAADVDVGRPRAAVAWVAEVGTHSPRHRVAVDCRHRETRSRYQ